MLHKETLKSHDFFFVTEELSSILLARRAKFNLLYPPEQLQSSYVVNNFVLGGKIISNKTRLHHIFPTLQRVSRVTTKN